MKRSYLLVVLMTLACVVCSNAVKADTTQIAIATFANPSQIASDWLFKVDFVNMKFTAGWPDSKTGLTLQISYSGHVFYDAWFSMTDVVLISNGGINGNSQGGPGTISFFENGTSSNPLLVIDFQSCELNRYGAGADEYFILDNVVFGGSEISDSLSDEQFSFSFTSLAKLNNNWNNGFTAAGSFSSSAVIPEPATLALLTLGMSVIFIGNKKG